MPQLKVALAQPPYMPSLELGGHRLPEGVSPEPTSAPDPQDEPRCPELTWPQEPTETRQGEGGPGGLCECCQPALQGL